MFSRTVAETMMDSMIDIAQRQAAEGKYPAAVATILMFISSVEDNDATVRQRLVINLVPLYSLRAKLNYEIGSSQGNASQVQKAQEDVHKAEAAFDEFYKGTDPTQRDALRAGIQNVVNADEKQRNDGLSLVLQLRTHSPASTKSAPGIHGKVPPRIASSASSIGPYAICFLIGLLVWGVFAALVWIAGLVDLSISAVFVVPAVPLFFLAVYLADRGSDWLYDHGFRGIQAKFIAFLLLAGTVVGLIPVLYWTGKGTLRLYYQRRGMVH